MCALTGLLRKEECLKDGFNFLNLAISFNQQFVSLNQCDKEILAGKEEQFRPGHPKKDDNHLYKYIC